MANSSTVVKWVIVVVIILLIVTVIVLACIPWNTMGFANGNCGKCSAKKASSTSPAYSGTLGSYSGTLGSYSGSKVSGALSSQSMLESQSYTYVSPSTAALADMVEEGDFAYSPSEEVEEESDGYSAQSLSSGSGFDDSRAMLPDSCSTYNVDISNPSVYLYRPVVSRALRTRQYETADIWRGDIPISSDPCKKGCFESQYAQPASLKYDAYFSNMCCPKRDTKIVNEGTIMDGSADCDSSSDYEFIE